MTGFFDSFQQARQQGYERGQQNRLQGLMQQAWNAPEQDQGAITAQIAGINPQAAAGMEKRSLDRRDRLQADAVSLARAWKSSANATPEQRQAFYQSFIAPQAQRRGLPLPPAYDAAAFDQEADALIAMASGGKAQNPYDGLPSDIQSLRLLQDNPQLAALDKERRQYSGMVPKLVETNQGIGWGTPGAGIDLAPITGTAGQPGGAQMAPQQLFAALGQRYGIQPTSVQRTAQRNAEVGGKPNSYHLSGQAADWVVPPAQKAQFMADARSAGYEAIDEGDHVHIEPAGRGGGATNIAQPFVKQDAPPAGFRRTADGNMEFIPGGPADPFVKNEVTGAQRAKLLQTRQKEQQMLRANEAALDQTITLIDNILKEKDAFNGVTGLGAAGARIPGTKWADIAAALDTLRGRSAFGALQQMRANSPTGGALGSVTERELGLLQNSETQLQDTQSPAALIKGLEQYKKTLQDTKTRMRLGVDEFYQGVEGGDAQSVPAPADQRRRALLDKY